MGEPMEAQATTIFAGLGLLVLASCTAVPGRAGQPLVPPLWAEQDRTTYNNQQIALFVSSDPGWQAWLNAILLSEWANNALVDASRYNTPVMDIIRRITAAQDGYRVATSFNLPPFTVTSGCRNLYSETTGHVQLSDGLALHYGFLAVRTIYFENGSYCRVSYGIVDEIDSSRGLPVATADRGRAIDWGESFSRYLTWHQPYWRISTGTTLSLSDMVGLIEK
jgi:hypothetical protein